MKLKVFKALAVIGVVIGVVGFLVGFGAAATSDSEEFYGRLHSEWWYIKMVIISILMMAGGYALNSYATAWVHYLKRKERRNRGTDGWYWPGAKFRIFVRDSRVYNVSFVKVIKAKESIPYLQVKEWFPYLLPEQIQHIARAQKFDRLLFKPIGKGSYLLLPNKRDKSIMIHPLE